MRVRQFCSHPQPFTLDNARHRDKIVTPCTQKVVLYGKSVKNHTKMQQVFAKNGLAWNLLNPLPKPGEIPLQLSLQLL